MAGASVTWTSGQFEAWLSRLVATRGVEAPRTKLGRAPHGLTVPLMDGLRVGFLAGSIDPEPCFEWPYMHDRDGYSTSRVGRAGARVYRYIYEYVRGPIGELVLDHLCRNRGCVNPHHLEPVTHAENIRRGEGVAALNASKTHCKRGHPFNFENTRHRKTGRACRTCDRAGQQARRSTIHSRASVTRAL